MSLSRTALRRDWREFDYSVVDIEGTGAQHREAEGIVDIAAVVVRNGSVSKHTYHELLDPGIKIPAFISQIHGIYDKDVRGRPTFDDIKSNLEEFLGESFLVAHNAAVERRVLILKLPSYKPELILDTLKMARALYGASHKYDLGSLIQRFNIEGQLLEIDGASKRHAALYDATAAAHAFVKMASENFPGGCPVQDLAEMCALNSDDASEKSARGNNAHQKRSQSSFGW